jgi:hypothetical protein
LALAAPALLLAAALGILLAAALRFNETLTLFALLTGKLFRVFVADLARRAHPLIIIARTH